MNFQQKDGDVTISVEDFDCLRQAEELLGSKYGFSFKGHYYGETEIVVFKDLHDIKGVYQDQILNLQKTNKILTEKLDEKDDYTSQRDEELKDEIEHLRQHKGDLREKLDGHITAIWILSVIIVLLTAALYNVW